MLVYTMEKLLTQQAQIMRDEGALDSLGGEAKKNLVLIATVPCKFWWHREAGSRSSAREYATEQRTIFFSGARMMTAVGVDLQPGDRIENILDAEGEVEHEGPFRVIVVESFHGSHQEAGLMRP